MRLFNRKPDDEPAPVCPTCKERVPEDADECAMCGERLDATAPATAPSADRVTAEPSRRT